MRAEQVCSEKGRFGLSSDGAIADTEIANQINDPATREQGMSILRDKYGEIMCAMLKECYGYELSDVEIEEAVEKAFKGIQNYAGRKALYAKDGTLSKFVASVCHGRTHSIERSKGRRQRLYNRLQQDWLVSHQDPALDGQPSGEEMGVLCDGIRKRIGDQRNTRAVFDAICDLIHIRGGLMVRGLDNPSNEAIHNYLTENGQCISVEKVKAARERLRLIVLSVMEELNWSVDWPKERWARKT